MPNFKLKQTSEQVQKAIDNALYPDKELTKEGVPADSKAVGIEIKKNSIHISTEPPTSGETVWIDTDEEPDENDSTQIDVIAQPGQIIAVKEVDANGKPTKWEAIDLPKAKDPETPDFSANEGDAGYIKNRTHYVDEKGVIHKLPNMYIDAEWMATKEDGGAGKTVFIPEQTVAGGMWTKLQGTLTVGVVYAVEVNGILYRCECRNYNGTLYLGNGTLLGGTEHNNDPFCIAWMGGTAKSGQFYTDGTLESPIGIKVSEWIDDIYNTLPAEFMPPVSWNNLTDRPVVDGVGEPFFTHTATFATDAAAKNGVQVPDASVAAMLNTVYWLDVNGELLKCHWERVSFSSYLYDEDGNEWASYGLGGVYVSAPTAGTYTYTLYAPADTPMFDPQYLPPNIATKEDVKVDEDLLDELLKQYVENNGNGGSSGETEPPTDGTSIDVTAAVGQTIVVKEIDADGKPTKWESADYQPRTHWSEEGMGTLVPHTVFTPILNPDLQMLMYMLPEFGLEVGKTYTVVYDGVEYPCTAVSGTLQGMDFISIGNTYLVNGTQTSEPFIVAKIPALSATLVINIADGPIHTIQINGNKTVYHKPAPEYAPNEYWVSFMSTGVVSDEGKLIFHFNADWDELIAAIKSGKNVYANHYNYGHGGSFIRQIYMLGFAEIGFTPIDGYEYTDRLMFGICHNNGNQTIGETVFVYRWSDGTVTGSDEIVNVQPT